MIEAISALLPPAGAALQVGVGDDAAVVAAPDGRIVATTDLLVEGRHFRADWSTAQDVGVKAAAQNLADIAAMGASPVALLLGLALPGSTDAEWILGVVAGLVAEAARAGAVVAGGDVTSADQVVLAVTALGDLAGRAPVTRSGARPGDQVAVHGRLGWSAAGLAVLAAGGTADAAAGTADAAAGTAGAGGGAADARGATAASLADLVAAHRRPRPDYLAGVEAATAGASAMIDISDGLIQDLRHVARASGVRLELSTAQLPGAGALLAAAEALGADWRTWALAGGEDHALAATFPAAASLPTGWSRIGVVRPGRDVIVDGADYPGTGGWQHFS